MSILKAGVIISLILISGIVRSQHNNIYVESAWSARDKWQRADRIIEHLKLDRDSHVADIGCHQGYMTVKLAKVIGTEGCVYAVDVDDHKLRKLKEILKERKLAAPVEVIKGEYDNPRLPSDKLDAVLILDTYHEIREYKTVLGHIRRALKPGGRLVILDPIADERKSWSRSEQNRKHELAMRYAVEDVSDAGFNIVRSEDPWIDRTDEKGDKMWMIVAMKP